MVNLQNLVSWDTEKGLVVITGKLTLSLFSTVIPPGMYLLRAYQISLRIKHIFLANVASSMSSVIHVNGKRKVLGS